MKRITQTDNPLIDPPSAVGPTQPHTTAYLNNRYFNFQRRLAYPQTTDRGKWQQWRRKLRSALRKTLCLDQLGPVPTPQPTILETADEPDYQRHKIAYETLPDNWVSAYLLIPRTGPAPKPAVLCPHGHFRAGKSATVFPQHAAGAAYAHELAKLGMITLAPDNAGLGERDDPQSAQRPEISGCMRTWVRLNHMGLDLTGLRVFDLLAAVNFLAARTDVDEKRIGCAGLSGGCWLSQLVTGLDRRFKAVVLSGFFTTFPQTVWHCHCICHHPFGIGTICDMPDLSALIAPRPQFVESGTADVNYPFEPAWSLVQKAYRLLGAADRLAYDRYQGEHLFHAKHSLPWMKKQLQPRT